MTPAKRLQHMACNSDREFSDDEVVAMSLCADAWNDMQGLRHEKIREEKILIALQKRCDEAEGLLMKIHKAGKIPSYETLSFIQGYARKHGLIGGSDEGTT